ncbi:signal peptidase I [Chloroflexota bacterium]
MKRALALIFIAVALVVGFLSIRGAMPFMPIFGSSMEPTLHEGSLLLIDPVDASKVEVGDIVVYNVPRMVREYYNYPPLVAHRVIKINQEAAPTFRTKGDNTGEDPFAIRAADLRGKVGKQIPYVGFCFLFLQSQQGLIFTIIALSLLAVFLYSGEMGQGGRTLQRGIFRPIIEESTRASRTLARKIDTNEQRMDTTQQALEKFASAIELYAQHLASHTSAIQGLSEASHELKRGAAEQNKVLVRLAQTLGQPTPVTGETISKVEPAVPEMEKAGPEVDKTPPDMEKAVAGVEQVPTPPGCAITRRALLKRIQELRGENS